MIKGIAKINFEIIHAVTNAMMYLSLTFLKKKPIPTITGHSLGGALATVLVYEYSQKISKIPNVAKCLSSEAICINFGTPRVLGKAASVHLCKMIANGSVLFHRFSNYGDIFTSLPPNGLGFYHPCSNRVKDYRKLVARDCNSAVFANKHIKTSDYNIAINCTNEDPDFFTKFKKSSVNLNEHGSYLYISFLNSNPRFGKPFSSTEIGRVLKTNEHYGLRHRDTETRVVQMIGNGKEGIYTANFADLVRLRERGDTVLHEDSKDTYSVFNILLHDKNENENENNVTIHFDRKSKLPFLFSKHVADNRLADVNNSEYIDALKMAHGFKIKNIKNNLKGTKKNIKNNLKKTRRR
jgi:hypothetical protein